MIYCTERNFKWTWRTLSLQFENICISNTVQYACKPLKQILYCCMNTGFPLVEYLMRHGLHCRFTIHKEPWHLFLFFAFKWYAIMFTVKAVPWSRESEVLRKIVGFFCPIPCLLLENPKEKVYDDQSVRVK